MTALIRKFNKLVQAGLSTANLAHESWIVLLFVECLLFSVFQFVMRGSCHLNRPSKVEIGVECQIILVVVFF